MINYTFVATYFRKLFLILFLGIFFFIPSASYAQEARTVLPGSDTNRLPISVLPDDIQSAFSRDAEGNILIGDCRQLRVLYQTVGNGLDGRYLATKIRCGQIHMGDVPFYITHALQFAVWIAGTIAVIMIMVGGYQYAIGGVTDNKEQGKQTIYAAIVGLIVVLISWIVINVVQIVLVTPTPYEGVATTQSDN